MQRRILSLSAILALGVASSAAAQRDDDSRLDCRDRDGWSDRRETYCTIVERTIRPGRSLRINAHPNGGVTVVGWDRREVELRAKVQAYARSARDAEDLVRDVEIVTDRGEIRVEGPDRRGRDESWYASFELHVPRDSDLWIRAMNGGIAVADVRGEMDLETRNGGLHLRGLAGNVMAHTTNGGVHVELDGSRWDGDRLDVRTTNGGVDLRVPQDYSADLETGTVNGGLDVEFPIRVRGRISRRIHTTLGDGGPPIRVVTTNGGVRIRRR